MKIIKNTLLLYSARGVELLATFIQLKILTIFLPKFYVGKIFFIIGIASFIATIFQAGFSFVFVRFVPKFDDSQNTTLLGFSMAIYFLGLIVSLIIGVPIHNEPDFWMMFSGVYIFGVLPLFGAYLIGKSLLKFLFLLTALRSIILVTLLYLLRNALTISNLGLIFLIAGISVIFVFYLVFHPGFDIEAFRTVYYEIEDFWKYAVLDQIFQPIFMYLYRIITPLVLNYEALASFTISRRIDNFSRRIFQVPLDIISPEISKRDTVRHEVIPILIEMKKLYVILSTSFFLGYIVLGKLLIILISTSAYLDAFRALLILGIGFVLSSTYSIDATYLRSIGYMKPYFLHNVIWMIAFIASFVVLGKIYGLSGLAAAYPIGHIFGGLYIKLQVKERELLKWDWFLLISPVLTAFYLFLPSRTNVLIFGLMVGYILVLTLKTDFHKLQLQR